MDFFATLISKISGFFLKKTKQTRNAAQTERWQITFPPSITETKMPPYYMRKSLASTKKNLAQSMCRSPRFSLWMHLLKRAGKVQMPKVLCVYQIKNDKYIRAIGVLIY